MPPLKNNSDGKSIMFCYFRDTAQYLYEAIVNDQGFLEEAGLKREEVALIHGGIHKGPNDPFKKRSEFNGLSRNEIVWRFSPISNIDADTSGKKKSKEKWKTNPIKL